MLIERARPILARYSPGLAVIHGLEQAAEIRDRAAYGLGLGPDDERVMGQVAEWAYDTVWERLGDSVQLRAMYRGLG